LNDSNPSLTQVRVTVSVAAGGRDLNDMQDKAYAMMVDVERYPHYMPSVNALDIVAQGEDGFTTRWDAQIDGAPLASVQRVRRDDAGRQMHFEAVEGDFEVFYGTWSVTASGGTVHLNLTVAYRLGIPVIEDVLGPILKEKVRSNCTAMLEAIAGRLDAIKTIK